MAFLATHKLRQLITVGSDSVGLSGNLTDQEVTVKVDSTNTDYWANNSSNGTHERFTSSDGSTLLKFELISFSDVNELAIWSVKVPNLTSGSTTGIYLYYNAISGSDGSDKANTWDANYKGVYHMDTNKAEGALDDSTSLNNDAINTGTTDIAGKIGRARDFDGVDDFFNINAVVGDVATDTAGTFEMWVRETDITSASDVYVAFGDTNANEYIICQLNGATNGFNAGVRVAGTLVWSLYTNNAEHANNTWTHFAVVQDGTAPVLYVNGVQVAQTFNFSSDKTAWFADTTGVDNGRIGVLNYNSGGDQFDYTGQLDEVTISNTARSIDWVKARYQSGLGTWLSFGAEETPFTPQTTIII